MTVSGTLVRFNMPVSIAITIYTLSVWAIPVDAKSYRCCSYTGSLARFDTPVSIAYASKFLYVADKNNYAVRALNLKTVPIEVTTLAGGRYGCVTHQCDMSYRGHIGCNN